MNATDDRESKGGCAAIRARLTLYALKDLDAETLDAIRDHLEGCEDCRTLTHEIEDALGTIQDALRTDRGTTGQAEILTDAHRDRIRAAAASAAATPGKKTGEAPARHGTGSTGVLPVHHGRDAHATRGVDGVPVVLAFWSKMLKSPLMKIAATVMVGYLLVSLLMPAGMQSRRTASLSSVQVMVSDAEPDVFEMLDEIRDFERENIAGYDLSFAAAGEESFKELEAKSDPEPDTTVPPPQRSIAPPSPGVSLPTSRAKPIAPTAAPAPEMPHKARESRQKTDDYRKAEANEGERSLRRSESYHGMDGFAEASAHKPVSMSEESVAPPVEAAQVRPAEFDSVAMVKSPLLMRGLHGSRSPRTAKSALDVGALVGDDDVAIEVVESDARGNFLSLSAAEPSDLASTGGGRSRDEKAAGSGSALPASGEKRETAKLLRMGGAAGERTDGDGLADVLSADALREARETLREARESRSQASDEGKAQTPRFEAAGVNPFVETGSNPFSTFSIDVDTASYTIARNYMLGGALPPPEAVRTEEFVNFFDYAYEAPSADIFRVFTEMAPSRFGRGLQLLKIGVKGRRAGREEQRPASLTLLVDTSGSMNRADRIGLVRTALELLLDALGPRDQVALVQFDSVARLLLDHTPVTERGRILEAIRNMQCGGGTNLEAGMRLAYAQAARHFVSKGENRVLLLSDGVANLGEAAAEVITGQVESHRRQGLYLSVFGLGMGTYDDEMLKSLASKGNGVYAFLDSEAEARRVFVDDLAATLNTIAEDVKIQVEFNPKLVARYRQFGYERRQLTREQFRDDTVDAGEVGSGQSVTALYELDAAETPPGIPVPYAARRKIAQNASWLAVVRVRYRRTDTGRVEEIEKYVYADDVASSFNDADVRFRLAAGVAAFAEILRGSPYVQGVEFGDVATVLRPVALTLSLDGRVQELMRMVETAGGLAR